MSQASERSRTVPSRRFPGKLRMPPRSAPQPEPAMTAPPVAEVAPAEPSAAVMAPAPPAAPSIAERVAALALCREAFPAVFDPDSPLPLALGIHEQLGELIGPENANALLRWWTIWPPYLAAVAAGGLRYQLDGSEAGEISGKHRDAARLVIANRAASDRSKRPASAS